MIKRKLYKYKENDSTIISFYEPNCEYEPYVRLVAQSKEHLLTNYERYVYTIDIPLIDEQLWFEVHKDDLKTPVSQVEEVTTSIKELTEKQKQIVYKIL